MITTTTVSGKIRCHKNLAPIRRRASRAGGVARVDIGGRHDDRGCLFVNYRDGSKALAIFADRKVMLAWVMAWKGAHGAELMEHCRSVGQVHKNHYLLKG